MIFISKQGKASSSKPAVKRKVSLINADFKVLRGLEVARYSQVLGHSPCPAQLAAAGDRKISFGICQARDAIYAAGMRRTGYGLGLADNEFKAAFNFLCLDWVRKVLGKKCLARKALGRFTNIYSDGISISVMNNMPGPRLVNNRLSLRQGDQPSGLCFSYSLFTLYLY